MAMALTDAINHLKESLADTTHKWGCEECKQEHEQLLAWLEDYKRLKDEMIPAYDESEIDAVIAEIQRCTDLSTPGFVIRSAETLRDEIAMLKDYKQLKADYVDLDNKLRTANTENDELKRMLRLAVEDFQNVEEVCVGVLRCGVCPANNNCKWKRHDEAMKLLGGTENAEN